MITKKLCIVFAWATLTLSMAAVMTGCAALETKAVAIASGVDAMKIETTGSLSSGTALPNIIVGGAVNSICTAPAMEAGKTAQPTYSKSRRNSFFGSLFGIDDTTETISYIGVPGETADETAKRCQALSTLSTITSNFTDKRSISSKTPDSTDSISSSDIVSAAIRTSE